MALGVATQYDAYYRKAFVNKPQELLEAYEAHGNVRAILINLNATDTGAATLTTSDVIYVGGEKLPVGATIIDAWLSSGAGAATSTTGVIGLQIEEVVLVAALNPDTADFNRTDSALLPYRIPIPLGGGQVPAGQLNLTVTTASVLGSYTITGAVLYIQD
jgi:hypothetical protein